MTERSRNPWLPNFTARGISERRPWTGPQLERVCVPHKPAWLSGPPLESVLYPTQLWEMFANLLSRSSVRHRMFLRTWCLC